MDNREIAMELTVAFIQSAGEKAVTLSSDEHSSKCIENICKAYKKFFETVDNIYEK